ncbi:hypothetical protein lerEdw1_000658 [Lerista edwardsae]|nr:hypothetical protein lerEdw1_000658 [Lerista edwardsae]
MVFKSGSLFQTEQMTLPPSNSRTDHLRMDSPVRHSGIDDNCPAFGATWPLEGPILTALSFLFTLASLTTVRPTAVAKVSRNPCEDVQVLQGVQDTRALVGKVFFYPLSPFAFQGKMTHYKVSLASGSALPKWLEYNASTSTLQGLPMPEERGDYRLMVTAYGAACGPHRPTTVVNFALHVQDYGFVHRTEMGQDQKNVHNNICLGAPCATKVSITFAELIIHHRTSSLGIQERLYLVCTMAEYLHLDPSSLTLSPFEDSFHRYLWNLTILAEDIRYVHAKKNNYVGLYWPVGFGVFAMFYELLQVLRHTMESNHLSQLLGYEIAGWRILKQEGHEKWYSGKRLRRQLMATPRLTPSPTKTEGFMVLSTTWLHTKSVVRSCSSLLDDVTKTAIPTYTGDFLRSVSSETDLEALDTQNLLNVQTEKSTSSALQDLSSAFPELLPSLTFTFSEYFLHSGTHETDLEALDTKNLQNDQTKKSTSSALQSLSSAFPELLPSLTFTFSDNVLHSVTHETDLETLGTHNLPTIQTKNSTALQDISSALPELLPSLIFTFSDDFLHSVTSEGDLVLDMKTQLNIQTKMTSSILQDFPSAFPELLPSLMTSAEMEDDMTSRTPPISHQLQSQVPQQVVYSSPEKSESNHHFVLEYFGFSVPTSKTQLSRPSHLTIDSYASPGVTLFKRTHLIISPDYSGPYAELTASGVILQDIISTATSGLIQDSKSFTAKVPVVPVSTLVNQRASSEFPMPMSGNWQNQDLSSNYKHASEVYMSVPQTQNPLLTEEHYSSFATIQSEIASWKMDFSFTGILSTSGSATASRTSAYKFGLLLDTSPTVPLYYSDSIPPLAMYSSTQEFNTSLSAHFLGSGFLSRTSSTPAQFPSLPLSLSTDLTVGPNHILPMDELFSDRRQDSPEVFQISEHALWPSVTVPERDGYLFTKVQISAFTATHIDTSMWNKQSHLICVAATSAPVLSSGILGENGLSRGTSWTSEWSSYGAPVLSWPIDFAGSLKSTNKFGSDYSRYVKTSVVPPGPPLHQDMSDVSVASSFGTQANFQITKELTSQWMKESTIPYNKETPPQPGFYATSMYAGAQGEANTSPRIVRAIRWLTATIGYKFSFSIPPDTFYDQEDGNTTQLTLGINPADYSPTGLESWLQFNSCFQTLYGYPLDHDFQYSPQEFVLFATDSGGLRAEDTLTIELLRPTLIPCHIYTIRTKNSYHSFLRNRERISLFFEKLSKYLNAGSPGNMILIHLRPGSTVIAWYNHSVCARTKRCATNEIQGVLNKLRIPGGNVHPGFIQAMLPEYKIDQIEDVTYGGICLAIAKPFNESLPSNRTLGTFKDSRSWIRNILPALLIGVSTTIMVILIISFHYCKCRKEGSGLQSAPARPFFSYVDLEMDVLKSRKPPILEQETPQAPRPWLHMPPPSQQHPCRPNRTLIASRLPPPPKYRLPPLYGMEESGQSCHDHGHRRSCPKASLY